MGIIVVDEEQDSSYKQEELPRYHARDVALKRGEIEKTLVILGSATPQLETFYHAVHGGIPEYENPQLTDPETSSAKSTSCRHERGVSKAWQSDRHLTGPERIHCFEVEAEGAGSGSCSIGEDLHPPLLCRSCGSTEMCENCSLSLTYHQGSNRLLCHYCGFVKPVPKQCGTCGREYIHFLGHGTEKVQTILEELFHEAAIDRLDRDTVQRKGSSQRILGAFASGQTDILIGTQMIAKGHDFPRVTLVGVLSAEQALRMADFRAAERTFQLLTQVAGRAGRGEHPGEVIIQTYFPNHYSLKHARSQDYRLFFEEEIRFRRSFHYPPFSALANVMIQGRPQKKAQLLAKQVADLFASSAGPPFSKESNASSGTCSGTHRETERRLPLSDLDQRAPVGRNFMMCWSLPWMSSVKKGGP